MSTSRFFFSAPSDHVAGSAAYVLVSPGHYGTRILDAHNGAEELRSKLRLAGIQFCDKGNAHVEMEFGNTNWDKRVMRVKMAISMTLSAFEAKKALKAAGFGEGLPDSF